MGQYDSSTYIQNLLDLLQAGHDSARAALLEHTLERFQQLARGMFHRQRDLRVLYETDDVIQEALVRLHRALAQVKPVAVRAFFALAARQIRWVLQDLARKVVSSRFLAYTGRTAPGSHPAGQGEPQDLGGEPCDLLEWADFHRKIEALPEVEREMFDLLLYQGLTQKEAADLLHLSLSTVKRRWQSARLLLRAALRGEWPGT
jgi:RNA polymerase sigma-70 factor (ECF subfamily)